MTSFDEEAVNRGGQLLTRAFITCTQPLLSNGWRFIRLFGTHGGESAYPLTVLEVVASLKRFLMPGSAKSDRSIA